ncbi:MAG: hypothetical protein BMS9Abin05_0612 [Rhodothermia bacterium]|nr:MAG: hypothetical protein BMS9Abin05_0612 [Rhodothermia bacterium]
MLTNRVFSYHFRFAVIFIGFALCYSSSSAQYTESDRQALIALYNATNGDNWTNNYRWLDGDVKDWYGVQVDSRGNVVGIDLSGNNLSGTIPYVVGYVWYMKTLNLQNNPTISGTIPLDLATLSLLETFWFDGTDLCESSNTFFQSWINGLVDIRRSGCAVSSDEFLFGECDRPQGEAFLEANNVRARILNTGGLFYSGSGIYEIPQSSGTTAIFGGNLWVVGIVDGSIRASAGKYSSSEMWAGPIDEYGRPPDDCTQYDRVYSIRKSDMEAYEQTGAATFDLLQWPTGLGAPTLDRKGIKIDLTSEPFSIRKDRRINLAGGERPDISGDQLVWWIMNDRGNEHLATDVLPLGIEVHGQAYAVLSPYDTINNATLYTYRIFNRNDWPISDAYVGIFSDPDLGFLNDDLIGADSGRGMGFVYNRDNDDEGGYGTAPPALGMLFLEGPVADSDGIDNDSNGVVDEPGEHLRTTTVARISKSGYLGNADTPLHWYNYLQGKMKTSTPITVGGEGWGFSGIPTHFMFSGDPVTGEFWSELNTDGQGTPSESGDRRMLISSGPFSLDGGEDTDFTFAIVWARGDDHLDSITELRKAADDIRIAFESNYLNNPRELRQRINPAVPNPAAGFGQNYPEPFSDFTTIKYRIPDFAFVRLVVLDVLGREVETLVNESQDAGEYTATFDGTSHPSGVYFYRIEINRASGTRAMVLSK